MVSVGMLLIKRLIGRKKTCKLCKACIARNIRTLYFPQKLNNRNAWLIEVIGEDDYALICDRLRGDTVYIQKTFLARSRWIKIRKDYQNGMTLKELCKKYHQTIDSIRKIVAVKSTDTEAVNAVKGCYIKEYPPGTNVVRYTNDGKVHRYITASVNGEKAEKCQNFCVLYRDFGNCACKTVKCKAYDRKDFRTIIFKDKGEK